MQYQEQLDNFNVVLDKECELCLIKYKQHVSNVLDGFPNVSHSMNILFSMKDTAHIKVKLAIIRQAEISLSNAFTSVSFVHNDEPDNYRHTDISLNDEVRTTLGAIDYGALDIGDVEPEIEIGCILLEYMQQSMPNDKEFLAQLVDETQSATLFRIINDSLGSIQSKLLKEIDKITK